MLTDGSVDRFADQNSQYYNPSYYMILKYIAIYEIILLAASLYMTYLFFLKSRMFPNLYIIIQIAAIAFWVVEYVLIDSVAYVDEMREYITEMLQDEIKYIRTSIMSVIIWVSYMLKSKRVKATFIE